MKSKFLFIVSLVIMFSCESDLKEEPFSFISPEAYFNTEAEVEAALYGAYNFMHDTPIADSRFFHLSEKGTDVGSGRRDPWRDGDMDLFEPDNSWWKTLYQAIGATNTVISRVENSENFSTEFKDQIVGEAKFLRAFYYYRLNMYWGNVPIWLDELVLDEVEKLATSPSEDVRNQIIDDLIDASNKLPETETEQGRATKWMSKGLLARVYLFNKNWQNAKETASDVITNSPHQIVDDLIALYDYNNPFNSEMIHVVPKLAQIKGADVQTHAVPRPFDDGPAIRAILNANPGLEIVRPLDGELITDVNSRNPGGIFQGWGTFQVLKEHYDSFEPGDLRKDLIWHYIDFTDGTRFEMSGGGAAGLELTGRSGYYPLKWVAFDSAPNNGSRSVYLQRLAELYLIFAEAENELNGPTLVAYNAINRIRARAFGDDTHALSGLSQDEFRKAIQDENRWELASEGVRKYYLWHWGFPVMKEVVESVAESLPGLAAKTEPHHQYFRIPSVEIAKNPNLTQNPGYSQ